MSSYISLFFTAIDNILPRQIYCSNCKTLFLVLPKDFGKEKVCPKCGHKGIVRY